VGGEWVGGEWSRWEGSGRGVEWMRGWAEEREACIELHKVMNGRQVGRVRTPSYTDYTWSLLPTYSYTLATLGAYPPVH
jgi:hypothetical protein